jgi:hypothetical protein
MSAHRVNLSYLYEASESTFDATVIKQSAVMICHYMARNV